MRRRSAGFAILAPWPGASGRALQLPEGGSIQAAEGIRRHRRQGVMARRRSAPEYMLTPRVAPAGTSNSLAGPVVVGARGSACSGVEPLRRKHRLLAGIHRPVLQQEVALLLGLRQRSEGGREPLPQGIAVGFALSPP